MDGSAASKKPIDQISKDDLLILLKLAISEESFEMDPYSTESVHNAAHQIIYKNIYQKFEDIRLHRVSFEDEKVNLYRTAINRYSSELSEYSNTHFYEFLQNPKLQREYSFLSSLLPLSRSHAQTFRCFYDTMNLVFLQEKL